jgi:hypothetical protein
MIVFILAAGGKGGNLVARVVLKLPEFATAPPGENFSNYLKY